MIDLIFNEFNLIILEIIFGSVMAFAAVIAFGKTKNLAYLFLVIASLFFYLILIFDVLQELNVFYLTSITINNIPLLKYILNYIPFIFLTAAFWLLIKKK